MGKARDLVSGNIDQLRELAVNGHAGLRDFAISNGLDNPAGFSAFKKELRAVGIDYDALRQVNSKPTYLTVPALKERGWTEAMVKRFLGEPDQFRDNPRYRSAAPMRLYAAQRVEEAESSIDFAEMKSKSGTRSNSAKKAAETRRGQLLAEVEAMTVHVRVLDATKLLRDAVASYNFRKEEYAFERGYFDYQPATVKSDPDFLSRIQVNYARHHLSKYDRHLEDVAGKTGVADAVWLIREKVYAAIALAYPVLADECRRQLAERNAMY